MADTTLTPARDAAHPTVPPGASGRADILTIGFATTVTMWAVGFVCRLPGAPAPSWLLFVLLIVCMLLGGVAAGRFTDRGIRGGALCGLVGGVLNLLIMGSLLSGDRPNEIVVSALVWLPGSLILAVLLGAAGAALGRLLRPAHATQPNWRLGFALVACGATLLLLAVGGSVTGTDSGLAVVDWPNTEGYNMFLYPLARMTGGIYYEHAHRLIGSLVGLTTLVLSIYLQLTERRRWVKIFAWSAFGLVVVQGILGGLRVTGRLTLSTDPADTAPNIVLAIIHGVIGQVFFGLLVALAVFLSEVWQRRRHVLPAPGAGTDRALGVVLIGMLLLQLVFGALVRHLTWALHVLPHGLDAPPEALIERGTWALHLHITFAVLVTLVAVGVGARAWGLYGQSNLMRRLGVWLLGLIGVQVTLGIVALFVVGDDPVAGQALPVDVLITTAHQTVGAILLGIAVALTLCQYRLLADTPGGQETEAAPAGA